MTATLVTEAIRWWLGWCPNTPALRTAPATLIAPSATANPIQPGSGSVSPIPGRIRHGVGIASGSIRAVVRNNHLLWFSLLAGLVILFLIVTERWSLTYPDHAASWFISIPSAGSFLIEFDLHLFLIEAACLSCFTLLLAGLILYRSRGSTGKSLKIRDALFAVSPHTGTLAAFSIVMALATTVLLDITSYGQILGKIESALSMAMFYLPYAYYFAPNGIFSALFFSFRIIVANIVLFLLTLYVVPVTVLENKGFLPALTGSITLMKKTWCELLGCILVFGAIVLVVAATGLLIGQSPALLNHDYDFFLQISRGQVLMTVVCYGFLLACGILVAIGSTAVGIAIEDLYVCGTTGGTREQRETGRIAATEPTG